ncbi:MAG: DUF3261 domain-containing protein [Alphaproteobacteria bacterium]|nr:DUF3261 domain-containing protein [Alphaproteobacteria bacterium]
MVAKILPLVFFLGLGACAGRDSAPRVINMDTERICPVSGVCVDMPDLAEAIPATPREAIFYFEGRIDDREFSGRANVMTNANELRLIAFNEDGRRIFSASILRDGRVKYALADRNFEVPPQQIAFDMWLAFARNPEISWPYKIRSLRGRRSLALDDKVVYTVRHGDDMLGAEIELRNIVDEYKITLRPAGSAR